MEHLSNFNQVSMDSNLWKKDGKSKLDLLTKMEVIVMATKKKSTEKKSSKGGTRMNPTVKPRDVVCINTGVEGYAEYGQVLSVQPDTNTVIVECLFTHPWLGVHIEHQVLPSDQIQLVPLTALIEKVLNAWSRWDKHITYATPRDASNMVFMHIQVGTFGTRTTRELHHHKEELAKPLRAAIELDIVRRGKLLRDSEVFIMDPMVLNTVKTEIY